MKKRTLFPAAMMFLAAFVLWTAAVCFVDVQPVGPQGSQVGFAAVNGAFHRLTGVHMSLYTVTDWLGLVPLGIVCAFGMLGLFQLMKRKSLTAVDRDILLLGGFYVVVMAVFVLFEIFPVNCRPILIEGVPETSYPSSTTMLALCVMPTAAMQLHRRVGKVLLRKAAVSACVLFTVFMVAGRLISGVHWLTDIIGGVLVSAGLVLCYAAFCGGAEYTQQK